MKAAIWYGPGRENFLLEDVPVPIVEEPDDIIVRVHSVFYGAKVVRAITKGHPELKSPTIMGRMIAGEIVDSGSSVQRLRKGDRVTIDPNAVCGVCYYCRNLEPVHCTAKTSFYPGGMAEYTRIRGNLIAGVYTIPSHVSYDEAAFTETLTCVAYGLLKADIIYGDTVVILGCGGVGLVHIPMASLRGAAKVILSGTHADALEIACRYGAQPVNTNTEDLATIVQKATDGRGADVVIEAVGKRETYEQAMRLVRPGGSIIAFGGCPPGTLVNLSPNDIHYRSLKVIGSYHYTPGLFQRALALISHGLINLKPILTHHLPLSRISEAIDIYTRPDCRTLVLHPTE